MNQTVTLINEISAELQRLEADSPQQEAYCWVCDRGSPRMPDLFFGAYAEARARLFARHHGGEAFPLYRHPLP